MGPYAGRGNKDGATGSNNVFLGNYSGQSITSGSFNALVGFQSGRSLSTGNYNVFVGSEAGYFNQDGQYNTFLGYQAGYNNIGGAGIWEGEFNTFLGYQAGYNSTSGHRNIAIGYRAGYGYSTNRYNICIGEETGSALATGQGNVIIGTYAGEVLNSGEGNVLLGLDAGYTATTATDNVMIGLASGRASNGNGNVFIGKYSGYGETGNDKFVIENNYTGSDNASNALIYGDFNSNTLRTNSNMGINYPGVSGYGLIIEVPSYQTKYYALYIMGSAYASGGTWQASDKSMKSNIKTCANALETVKKLRGVTYDWNPELIENKGLQKGTQIGVIAQELETVLPGLVREDMEGNKAVNYDEITPLLIEAIKEQQKMIDELKAEIELLKNN
jgi:hypothetical protein